MLQIALALLLAAPTLRQDPVPAAAKEARLAACNSLVERVCAAFHSGKVAELEACLALDPLFEMVTGGIETPEDFRKGFVSGARKNLVPTFLGSVHEPLAHGGELKLLRVREREGELRPLLRIIVPSGAFSYIEFKLCDGAGGEPKVCDWISTAAGEWTSELMRHAYLPLAEKAQHGILERLLGRDQLLARHWPEVEELVACVRKKDFEGGLAVCKRMPEELRHDKFVLLQRLLLVGGHSDDPEYLQVLGDLRQFHPDDASSNLHAIDFHYLRKEFQLAREAVGRLRDSIDGDPYLDYFEAGILLAMHKDAEARAAIEKSLAGEPERLKSHWTLVTVCLQLHDHAAVLEELERMDKRFQLKWSDLGKSEAYKDFVASPEHEQWLAYLAAKH
jgi:hypothetical protein